MSWAVRKQAEAERGEASPESAALVWVLQLSAGEELRLSRVLAKPRLLCPWPGGPQRREAGPLPLDVALQPGAGARHT